MTDRTYRITDPFERTIDRHAGELNERGPQDGHDAEAFGVVRLLLHLHPADPQVVEAMAEVLRDGGCEVTLAAIEFTDPRYADRFKEFPMPHPFREVVGMLPMEIRRGKGEIGIPDEVNAGGYDLVCVGSPTWWFSPSVPIRSFLESDAGHRLLDGRRFAAFAVCRRYWKHNLKTVRRIAAVQGGTFVEGIHFRYEGGQVRSLLSLLSYLGSGENRERDHGVKIPQTNIQEHHLETARAVRERVKRPTNEGRQRGAWMKPRPHDRCWRGNPNPDSDVLWARCGSGSG